MNWIRRHPTRLDPDELTQKAEESLKQTRSQQAWVDYLNTWLINRKNANGLGEDVEITFVPRSV
jgi:hypothetical protein